MLATITNTTTIAAAPLAHTQRDHPDSQEQKHDVADRRAAIRRWVRIRSAREEIEPGCGHCDADDPADQKCGTIHPSPGREEHQDAGDDRNRADRDAQREWQEI